MIERARYLYHVTKPENVESIMREGLRRGGKRRGCMVHLSASPLSWWREGLRILRVDISGLDHIEANTFLPKSDEVIFWGDIPPTITTEDGEVSRIEDVTSEYAMNQGCDRYFEAMDKKYPPQAVSALATIMELSDENKALREMLNEPNVYKAYAVNEMVLKFAAHIGTYRSEDAIKVSEVFELLHKFAEEIKEGYDGI